MNEQEHRPSLADAAASWVPPWERAAPEPAAPEPSVLEPVVPEPVALETAGPQTAGPESVAPDTAAPDTAEVPEPEAEVAPETQPEPAPGPEAGIMLEPESGAVLEPAVPAAAAGVSDEAEVAMDPPTLRGAVEAILLVVDEPTGETVLAQVLGQPAEAVAVTLAELAEEYARTGRGFELRRAAGGWRLYTRPEFASYVERFVLDGQQVRLTQAALETLAVVAYKQPVTRSRISAIRGVNCDGVVRTLVSRGLIEECGTEPESGAYLYRTTPLFLERLGLDSVAELPPLAPFLPDDVDEIANDQR